MRMTYSSVFPAVSAVKARLSLDQPRPCWPPAAPTPPFGRRICARPRLELRPGGPQIALGQRNACHALTFTYARSYVKSAVVTFAVCGVIRSPGDNTWTPHLRSDPGHVVAAGVLVHGFPDTPFTWRHLGPDLGAGAIAWWRRGCPVMTRRSTGRSVSGPTPAPSSTPAGVRGDARASWSATTGER